MADTTKMKPLLIHKRFWLIFIPSYSILLALTMYKDFYLTGNQPNPLFYLFVPQAGTFGAAGVLMGLGKLFKKDYSFPGILKVIFITEFIMQIWENLSKIVYHAVWEYPGYLWFIIFPLAFTLKSWLFVRIIHCRWHFAWFLTLLSFLVSILCGMGFMALTGIDTPGS